MRSMTRDCFLRVALGGLVAAGAPRIASAYNPRERLLVSVIAMRRGDILGDEAESYRPHHQHQEQVLTVEFGEGALRRTAMFLIWDREAGGVAVACWLVGERGEQIDRRDFVMYPFMNQATSRTEAMRLPIRLAGEGARPTSAIDQIDLLITMKRVERGL